MEMKLMRAAAQLPEPKLDFQTIEAAAWKREVPKRKNLRLLRAALAVVLVLALATTAYAYGKMNYGLWSGYRSGSFADVELLSRHYDYMFPEELNGSPFLQMSTSLGAPQGASYLEALLTPTYKLHSIDYGVRTQEQREDALYEWTGEWICVSFGTTQKDTWKYHFSVSEDGSCNYEGVDPDSQRVVEYEGYTLHLYSTETTHNVRWEDEERSMVIDVTCWDVPDLDAAVEAAKALIDLNR